MLLHLNSCFGGLRISIATVYFGLVTKPFLLGGQGTRFSVVLVTAETRVIVLLSYFVVKEANKATKWINFRNRVSRISIYSIGKLSMNHFATEAYEVYTTCKHSVRYFFFVSWWLIPPPTFCIEPSVTIVLNYWIHFLPLTDGLYSSILISFIELLKFSSLCSGILVVDLSLWKSLPIVYLFYFKTLSINIWSKICHNKRSLS